MGKQGPCYHCGVRSTPLWRNGPPDKPVLCNACGSRWRTKGTLVNYTPLHARPDFDEYEDQWVSQMKSISKNQNKEINAVKVKGKLHHRTTEVVERDYSGYNVYGFKRVNGEVSGYNKCGFKRVKEEVTSNRSSSGSAISNSESCAQLVSVDASDLSGPLQANVWESIVPSRKRTCINRPKQSAVEKLTKDLYMILQEQQSLNFTGSSDEDLLFESKTPIGHGSVLIRQPNSLGLEIESEASSLSVELQEAAYSHSMKLRLYDATNSVNFSSRETQKAKIVDQLKWDKSLVEQMKILRSQSSPLCGIDLTGIINFEEFVGQLTNEEQYKLMKYLPGVDTVGLPNSLENMFDSFQFKDSLSSFQQLLAIGVFDPSVQEEDPKAVEGHALFDSTKSNWVESYHKIKKPNPSASGSVGATETCTISSNNLMNVKREYDCQKQKISGIKTSMKNPKIVTMKGSYQNKEYSENNTPCFSPRALFALPLDGVHLIEDDLLVDVPSNCSFPQAELLRFNQQATTSGSSAYSHYLHP